jgi:hypothetical protein
MSELGHKMKQAISDKTGTRALHKDDDDADDDGDNKPVWPTSDVGALFWGARCIHINCVCFHITPPSLRSRDILVT